MISKKEDVEKAKNKVCREISANRSQKGKQLEMLQAPHYPASAKLFAPGSSNLRSSVLLA
jgi:hypothetical protein